MDKKKEIINALVELANYIFDNRQSALYGTDKISEEAKQILLNDFSRENREETINTLLND